MLLNERQQQYITNCSCQPFESIISFKNNYSASVEEQQNKQNIQEDIKEIRKQINMPVAQVADAGIIINDPLADAMEIIPDRLYYAAFKVHPSNFSPHITQIGGKPPNRPIHFFSIDNELMYWNFFLDYGPLNLGQLYKFCHILNKKLVSQEKEPSSKNKIICYYSSAGNNKRANALFLICAWQVLYLHRTPEEAMHSFTNYTSINTINKSITNTTTFAPLEPFHDASPCLCTYDLCILDCLRGLVKARMYKFFDFDGFNVDEYEYYEQVENGDLNWIIKDKIIAFAGPHNTRTNSKHGYCTLTPDEYIPYFHKKKVNLVVRLNRKNYMEQKFLNAGINFAEHYYLDGSVPSKKILQNVVRSFETCGNGSFAVHCKAGLGRTGTCIGAYIMKHYKFTASEVIGWMRICRPGCVIGPQQHFLEEIQSFMWHEGDIMRLKVGKPIIAVPQHQHTTSITTIKPKEKKKTSSKNSKRIISNTATATTQSSSASSKVLCSITKQLQFGSLSVSCSDGIKNNNNTKEAQADALLIRRQQHQQQMN